LAFAADIPSGFDKAWTKFQSLQLSQASLLDRLVESENLSRENSERVGNMLRVVNTPVDRLVVQFGLAKRGQVLQALRRVGGLETAADNDHHGDPRAAALLAPGFSRRTGAIVRDLSPDGATIRLEGLLAAPDLAELHSRCEGLPVRFELFPS
jgi:hypothetical protein